MDKIQEFLQGVTVLDTETTGVDFNNSEVIEVAGGRYVDGEWEVKELLMGSKEPIPPGASAVNYISNKMIAGLPTFSVAINKVNETISLDNTEYMIAHNSNFDRRIMVASYKRISSNAFDKFKVQEDWICTWKLAQQILGHHYDEIKYSQSYLRYLLDLDVDDSLPPHRAASDVTTCGKLLEKLIEFAIEFEFVNPTKDIGPQLQALCWKPLIIRKWPLGKHKGKLVADVPSDYLFWCIDNIDLLNEEHAKFDKDLAHTVEKTLESRL